MSAEKKPFLAPSMTEWTTRLAAHNMSAVSIGVDQGRFKAMETIEQLSLPHNRWSIVPVNSFLQDPESHTKDFPPERRFTVLASRQPHTLRFRKRSLDNAGVIALIQESLTPEMRNTYNVILEDSPVYQFGGNIVCTTNGAVRLEMNEGRDGQSEIVGGKTPEYVVERDLLSGLFKHSYDNESVRRAAWRTITSIPHTYNPDHAADYAARGIQFHPGYYEFYLDERLRPLFIDYTDSPAFVDLPTDIRV